MLSQGQNSEKKLSGKISLMHIQREQVLKFQTRFTSTDLLWSLKDILATEFKLNFSLFIHLSLQVATVFHKGLSDGIEEEEIPTFP